MRLATLALVALAAPAALAQTSLYPGTSGAPLLDALAADYAPDRVLGYGPARDSLYAYEQRTDGALCGVYTAYCIQLTPGADASTDAYHKGINAEHTWPQSMGAGDEPSKSDLHHLFPAKDNVNSSRQNHPYGEIPDDETDGWYREASSQSTIPAVFVDEWSEKDNDHPDPAWGGRFEPRHDHKGNAARAVFYYRAVYPEQVEAYGSESFFEIMREDLLAWHESDPVDAEEQARSEWIASLQGAPNPFVLDSTLARRAFDAPASDPGPGGGSEADPGEGEGDAGEGDAPVADVWVNEIHYDNEGADADEGVEIAGPAGTDLSGWSLALYNGNNGGVYQTAELSGTVPDQQQGVGALWVPVEGLQNGAPDGLALVAPDGTVVQFLSYEGALTAADGPAAGLESVDIGVAESGSTPTGHSLQLSGTGTTYEDFTWASADGHTRGELNRSQIAGERIATAQPEPLAGAFELSVYPNPTPGAAYATLDLPHAADVHVDVVDRLGRRVAAVHLGTRSAGRHVVALPSGGLPAGAYAVRVRAGGRTATRLLTVAR